MPHRIISSIISSQLTGGTFLAVLGSSSQLQERVHKPSLILHCRPWSHPVLLLLISSWSFSFSAALVLFSRGTRATMGSRWWSELKCSGRTSRGVWQIGIEIPSLEEAPLKASLCPLIGSTLQAPSFLGDKKNWWQQCSGPSFSLGKSLPGSYNQMDFNILTLPFQQRKKPWNTKSLHQRFENIFQ